MSHLSEEQLVEALHRAVPEPPDSPGRLGAVRRRAATRRRRQLAAGSTALVAAVAGVAAVGVDVSRPGGYATTGVGTITAGATPPPGEVPAALVRPLHLTAVPAGAACPVSAPRTFPAGGGFSSSYSGVGDGPVAIADSGRETVNFATPDNDVYAGTGWPGTKVIWRIDPSYTGPVLIRGARLDGPGELRFDHYLGAIGERSAGDGTPDATAYPTLAYEGQQVPALRTFPSALRMQAPGCYGVQVDGTSFSEVITVQITASG